MLECSILEEPEAATPIKAASKAVTPIKAASKVIFHFYVLLCKFPSAGTEDILDHYLSDYGFCLQDLVEKQSMIVELTLTLKFDPIEEPENLYLETAFKNAKSWVPKREVARVLSYTGDLNKKDVVKTQKLTTTLVACLG